MFLPVPCFAGVAGSITAFAVLPSGGVTAPFHLNNCPFRPVLNKVETSLWNPLLLLLL